MGQFILNGRNYSGLTYANGCFIDTDNVIQAETSYTGSFTYTASQDCYVLVGIASINSGVGTIAIDGVPFQVVYNTSGNALEEKYPILLKKGQVLSVTSGYNIWTSKYTVYGIQEGSPVTFLSEYASACYDTNEREVGCWIDGKPLYQRSFHYSFTASSNDYSYDIETLSSDIVVQKIETDRFSRDGVTFNEVIYPPNTIFFRYGVDESTHKLGVRVWNSDTNVIDGTVTLLYTKTTDVAGSGKLTPTAMPTVHYDSNEKIIGTWFGETLYEKTVVYNNPTLGRVDDLPHNIANIDTITNVEWVALESSGSAIVGHENNDSNWWADFFVVNRTGVSYRIGGSWGVTKIVVTIQYTKTT